MKSEVLLRVPPSGLTDLGMAPAGLPIAPGGSRQGGVNWILGIRGRRTQRRAGLRVPSAGRLLRVPGRKPSVGGQEGQ